MTLSEPDRVVLNGSPPSGWRRAKLSEVCEINPPRPALSRADSEPTTFVPMAAVDEGQGVIVGSMLRPFGEVRKGYTYFQEGDVLFAKITPCMQNGKHAIARGLLGSYGFGTTEFHVIRPRNGILPEWVHFFVRRPDVLEAATAQFVGTAGQQRLPEDYLAQLEISLPPLSEQTRIVGMLKGYLETITRAEAATEAQLEAVKALQMVFLRKTFSDVLSRGCPRKLLGDLCDLVNGDAYRETDWSQSGLPIIRIQNLNDPSKPYNHWAGPVGNRVQVKEGDLLLAWSGTPGTSFGAHIWKGEKGLLNQHIFRVDIDQQEISAYWLMLAVNEQLDVLIRKSHGGVGLRHVTRKEVESLRIALPPIKEQNDIVTKLMDAFGAIDTLMHHTREQLSGIQALLGSLLQAAFAGRM